MSTHGDPAAQPVPPAEGLGKPAAKATGGKRQAIRSKPGLGQLYRVGVFALGLFFIAAGIALMALPGPLTIPPVLLGLWIWSWEFRFAERLFDKFQQKGREAWAHAKRHPASSALITGGGLIAAAAAFWAVSHYELVARARDAL